MVWTRILRETVIAVTVFSFMATAMPVPAQARLASTEAALEADAGGEREKVRQFLARDDVRQQMESLGVSPDEAAARVDTMSDAEIRQIAGRLDEIPAGGDALGVVIGAAVLIFIVLLITDIAGLTKVFPWTRSVR